MKQKNLSIAIHANGLVDGEVTARVTVVAYPSETPGLLVHRSLLRTSKWQITNALGRLVFDHLPSRRVALAVARALAEVSPDWSVLSQGGDLVEHAVRVRDRVLGGVA